MPQPILHSLGRVLASDEEARANVRARSAVLRAAERTSTPLPADGGASFVGSGLPPAGAQHKRAAAGRRGKGGH